MRLAALDAEVKGLKELLAEVRVSRGDLRQERDTWRSQAERATLALTVPKPEAERAMLALTAPKPKPKRRPSWRRLVG